jgi:mono/diheme cytochrome c family protein
MNFPIFHMDLLGDRWLIAIIAVLHVIINHGLAVGFIPLIVWLEKKGFKPNQSDWLDLEWDKVVYKLMFVGFVITTSLGAMTGVGIWLSAALISPASLGSLIRVFYWAWFTEWLVFVSEVVMIMFYFLTWKKSNRTPQLKARHLKWGWYLATFSWITMAIIVAILGFMMDPTNWNQHKSLLNGFLNTMYLPQLMFRTPMAALIAGSMALFMVTIFTPKGNEIRHKLIRSISQWNLIFAPIACVASLYYYSQIPDILRENLSTAVATMQFAQYYQSLNLVLIWGSGVALAVALMGVLKPQGIRWPMALLIVFFSIAHLGMFERVREFIRKPYIIGNYMYSNQIRVQDYPLFKKEGILPYTTYSPVKQVTEKNELEAGHTVFMVACSRCHTAQGTNSILKNFEGMYGAGKEFDIEAMARYIPGMHKARPYMPPFPGSKEEAHALAVFIQDLQKNPRTLEGAQTIGAQIPKD